MPSSSDAQRRFMAWAASSPKAAKEAGISQSVAKEFHSADQRKDGAKKVTRALMKRK